MLVACRPVYPRLKGTLQGSAWARKSEPCGCAGRFFWVSANGTRPQTPASLNASSSLAVKSRRLAGISRLGGEGAATSLGPSKPQLNIGEIDP